MESNGFQEFQWFSTVSSVRVPCLVMKEENFMKESHKGNFGGDQLDPISVGS